MSLVDKTAYATGFSTRLLEIADRARPFAPAFVWSSQLVTFLRQRPDPFEPPLNTKTPDHARVSGDFLSSGGGIRTRDLRVMSPTSYQTAPPRGGLLILAAVGWIGQKNRRCSSCGHPV